MGFLDDAFDAIKKPFNQIYYDVRSGISGVGNIANNLVNKTADTVSSVSKNASDAITTVFDPVTIGLIAGGSIIVVLLLTRSNSDK